MSRHCFCDVATLNVDVALLLRMCSDVVTLSCDVMTLMFFTLPTLVNVVVMS